MYRKLWNLIKKIVGKKYAVGMYLAVNIFCWTAASVLVGILCVLIFQGDVMYGLANIFCAGAYMGIIFGLFGGILFLMRNTEPKDL